MGIPGLLPALKDFTQMDAHIRQFQGQAIAVDTSGWLHKAVYSVADTYVISDEQGRVDQHCVRVASQYLLQRCQELVVHANVDKIFLVMDGQHRCPLKAVTHQERTRKRALALEQARQAPNKQAAYEKYKACIRISHAFTKAVLVQVRKHPLSRQHRIILVQSPHEADAQLVQLAQAGHVQAIITEDSDVLVYAATAKSDVTVIYKFNRHTGACQTIRMSWLWDRDGDSSGSSAGGNKGSQQPFWRTLQSRERTEPGAGRRLFVQGCVATGCDYAPNELPGVGLVKAFALVTNNTYLPADQRFVSIVRGRLSQRSMTAPYVDKLRQAEAVFYYHPVRDPFSKKIAWMTFDEPCAPAFPSDKLDILGNPDELRLLAMPGIDTVNHERSQQDDGAAQLPVEREQTKPAADDAYLEDISETQKSPTGKLVTTRGPVINPYRKRPLATSSSPNQKPRRTFNPFAHFRHAIEKENNGKTAKTQVTLPRSSAAEPQTKASPIGNTADAPTGDVSVTNVSESVLSLPDTATTEKSLLSFSHEDAPTDDGSTTDSDETVVQSSRTSDPTNTSRSFDVSHPLSFVQPQMVSQESVPSQPRGCRNDELVDDGSATNSEGTFLQTSQKSAPATRRCFDLPVSQTVDQGPVTAIQTMPSTDNNLAEYGSAYQPADKASAPNRTVDCITNPHFGKSGPQRVTQGTIASQPPIDLTAPPPPVAISKPSSADDFYDDWLSPKNKESAPLAADDIEIEESPSPVKNKPVGPQGAMRFRLAGLTTTTRPLLTSKVCPIKKPPKRKLVYQPPRSLTLRDHFRSSKGPAKSEKK